MRSLILFLVLALGAATRGEAADPTPIDPCELEPQPPACLARDLRDELDEQLRLARAGVAPVTAGFQVIARGAAADADKARAKLEELAALTARKQAEFAAVDHPIAQFAASLLGQLQRALTAGDGPIPELRELAQGLGRGEACLRVRAPGALASCGNDEIIPGLVVLARARRLELAALAQALEQQPAVQQLRAQPTFGAYVEAALALVREAEVVMDRALVVPYMGVGEPEGICRGARDGSAAQAERVEAVVGYLRVRGASGSPLGLRMLGLLEEAARDLRLAEASYREVLDNPYPVPPMQQNEDVALAIRGAGGQLRAWLRFEEARRELEGTLASQGGLR